MRKQICVIGLGYIGLPTAAVFAENHWNVTGVDINPQIVEDLNHGMIGIEEKGLAELVKTAVHSGYLKARKTPVESDVFIISVPTPHNEDLSADLTFVKEAVASIIPVLKQHDTIIIESTIPPRTTRDAAAPILENDGWTPGQTVFLAHCPERVLPGKILQELYETNRIVGGINEESAKQAAEVYRTFVQGKVMETTAESAEMSKLMENTYRDVNIALANELTKISEGQGTDPLEVISLANEHPRVNIHQPGPGVGGHCLAVDPYFIIERDPVNAVLMRHARMINESMPQFIVDQVKKIADKKARIAVFGLAYKGNIDDVRESPAIKIIHRLQEEGFNWRVYDPYIKQEKVSIPVSSYEDALQDAEVLLIVTDHQEFKVFDWEDISKRMKHANILDTKNCVQNIDEVTNNIHYYNFNNLYDLY